MNNLQRAQILNHASNKALEIENRDRQKLHHKISKNYIKKHKQMNGGAAPIDYLRGINSNTDDFKRIKYEDFFENKFGYNKQIFDQIHELANKRGVVPRITKKVGRGNTIGDARFGGSYRSAMMPINMEFARIKKIAEQQTTRGRGNTIGDARFGGNTIGDEVEQMTRNRGVLIAPRVKGGYLPSQTYNNVHQYDWVFDAFKQLSKLLTGKGKCGGNVDESWRDMFSSKTVGQNSDYNLPFEFMKSWPQQAKDMYWNNRDKNDPLWKSIFAYRADFESLRNNGVQMMKAVDDDYDCNGNAFQGRWGKVC
jgi:hypothetical protein